MIFFAALCLFSLSRATQSSKPKPKCIVYKLEASPRPWRWYIGEPVPPPKLPEHYAFEGKNHHDLILCYDKDVTRYMAQKAYLNELYRKADAPLVEHDCTDNDNFSCLACEITLVKNQLSLLEDELIVEYGEKLYDIRWYYCLEAMRCNAACKRLRGPSELCKYGMIRKKAYARSVVASELLKKYRLKISDENKVDN